MYGSLHNGRWETRRVAAAGGTAEKIVDGFFRGDWIRKADGSGMWLVTSNTSGGVRLIDFEHRAVVWEDRLPGNAMPMFSPDGRFISMPYQESRDRDAIRIYDTMTGKGRLAVHFPDPFQIIFRANWIDEGRAFVVNRGQTISHFVMLDRFATSAYLPIR